MFNEMRRIERQIQEDEAEQILIDGDYGVLALHGTEGYPYAVPLNYVYKNKCIYFHCAKDGYKIDCINKDLRVSFCVVGKSEVISAKFTAEFSSVIAFGNASEVSGEEKVEALKALIDKYSKDYIKEGYALVEKSINTVKVIKINVEHLTGKARK
jgi:nitroimidazol reductase NimA-like FMN-containing flavoprotein (pyridoxamine 5'-phosphate oxidase superfamily)